MYDYSYMTHILTTASYANKYTQPHVLITAVRCIHYLTECSSSFIQFASSFSKQNVADVYPW